MNGSRIDLINRNYYFNHDYKDEVLDGVDWAHGLLARYQSGFTNGLVGYGVDVFGNIVLKLDEKNGSGAGNLAQGHSFNHFGGAVKIRVSNTIIKYGSQSPISPVLASIGSRVQPLTAYGLSLISEEVSGLKFEAGHFIGGTGWNGNNRKDPLMAFYAGIEVASLNYVGSTFIIAEGLSVSFYGADLEDIWRQYYGGLGYKLPIDENRSIDLNFNMYKTRDEGKSLAGDVNNSAFSLGVSFTNGAHRFTVVRQEIKGDEPMDYVGQGRENSASFSIYLGNSAQTSDFNGPGEKSNQIRHDLDMAAFGVPGLTFMARYIYGYNVDGTKADPMGAYYGRYGINESEREYGIQVGYTVQNGPAKDLSVQIRQFFHRGSVGLDSNQFRLMVSHPLNIL